MWLRIVRLISSMKLVPVYHNWTMFVIVISDQNYYNKWTNCLIVSVN